MNDRASTSPSGIVQTEDEHSHVGDHDTFFENRAPWRSKAITCSRAQRRTVRALARKNVQGCNAFDVSSPLFLLFGTPQFGIVNSMIILDSKVEPAVVSPSQVQLFFLCP